MKRFLLVLLFTCTITFYIQGATITIGLQYCEIKEAEIPKNLTIRVEVMKNGSMTDFFYLGHKLKDTTFSIDTGVYTITCQKRGSFSKKQDAEITQAGLHYTYNFCIESFSDSYNNIKKPVIPNLNQNDTFIIMLKSSGCFHYYNEDIKIIKMGNDFYVHSSKANKKLSNKEIAALTQFEKELDYYIDLDKMGALSNGCTTTSEYIIAYKGKVKRLVDGGCAWENSWEVTSFLMGE